jgi:hypothetical protein
MIRRAVDSDVPAENASRFQQPLGMPLGHPTASTAPTMTGYSWCPLFPAGPLAMSQKPTFVDLRVLRVSTSCADVVDPSNHRGSSSRVEHSGLLK